MATALSAIVFGLAEQAPPAVLSREGLRDLGPVGDQLLSAGAFEAADNLGTVLCDACDLHHAESPEFDPATRQWSLFCPEAGRVAVGPERLEAVGFRHSWLAEQIADSLGLKAARVRSLLPNRLWDLGDATAGTTTWTALFGCGIGPQQGFGEVLAELEGRAGKAPGLLFTTSPLDPNLPLPRGHRIMRLADCAGIDPDGALVLDLGVIHRTLRARPFSLPRGRAGRPTARERIVAEYERRLDAGVAEPVLAREASALSEWHSEAHPTDRQPAVKTIEGHIRAARHGRDSTASSRLPP